MKNFIWIVMLSYLICGCASSNVFTDYDKSIDFSTYKTFAWKSGNHRHKKGAGEDDIMDNNIINFTNKELEELGYKLDTSNPDMLLDFNITVEKRSQMVSGPNYRVSPYGMRMNARVRNVRYKAGILTISVTDRKNNQMVWKGWSESRLSDPQSFSHKLSKTIHAIFKKYPATKKQKSQRAKSSDPLY